MPFNQTVSTAKNLQIVKFYHHLKKESLLFTSVKDGAVIFRQRKSETESPVNVIAKLRIERN